MRKRLCLFFAFALAVHAAFPQTVDEYLNIGEKYLLEGRFHEARSAVGEAILLDPNYALSYLHMEVINFKLNELILALGFFSIAIDLDNTIAEAYSWRADICEALNDRAQAISDYNMTVYLEPENDRYRRDRGNFLYTIVGDSASAIIDFDKAVEIDPLNYKNFQQRGVFYLNHGRYETALDDLNAAIRLNSEDADNFSNKAVTLFFMGRYEEALENFNIALRLDSNDHETYFDRGHVHYELGMYNEALLDFTEAIRINPNYRSAYFNRAYLFRLLADQTDDPVQARYYRTRAQIDEDIVARLDGQRER